MTMNTALSILVGSLSGAALFWAVYWLVNAIIDASGKD